MPFARIALANLAFPDSPDAAVQATEQAIAEAAAAGADLVCFPECFVPGYRALGAPVPPADAVWLEEAHRRVAEAAGVARIAVALGTERFVAGALRITVLVVGPDGVVLGWQDKVQLDPSEEGLYEPGAGRGVFTVGELTFGVVICHEGWRYPETVRAAVQLRSGRGSHDLCDRESRRQPFRVPAARRGRPAGRRPRPGSGHQGTGLEAARTGRLTPPASAPQPTPGRVRHMRLVFAGTPHVAAETLTHLLTAGNHDVAAVLTRPDAPQGRSSRPVPSPVAQLAAEHGIEVLRPARPGDPELASRLAELAPDCCPVVAYGGLIPKSLLDLPRYGWVNVHFSLLPRWRGAAPVQHAILAGDEVTGVTVFEIVEGLDAGPVLATSEYTLAPAETAGEALAALQQLGAAELLRTLDGLAAGALKATPQPAQGITLAPKLTVAGARIDWNRTAVEISRQVRANNPSPVAWTELDEQRFRVLLAVPADGEDLAPGELRAGKRSVLVGTGSGSLELQEVQPAGKRPTAAADWGRGLHGERRFT